MISGNLDDDEPLFEKTEVVLEKSGGIDLGGDLMMSHRVLGIPKGGTGYMVAFEFNGDASRLKVANRVVKQSGCGEGIVEGNAGRVFEPDFGEIEHGA